MPWWLGYILDIVAKFFARMVENWRRDQELKELGAAQQREKDLEKVRKLREEADAIEAEVAKEGAHIGDDL